LVLVVAGTVDVVVVVATRSFLRTGQRLVVPVLVPLGFSMVGAEVLVLLLVDAVAAVAMN
jgi:hypothetical protein